MKFLSELKREDIKANGVKINTFYSKSDKKPLLLLHGFPQSAIMWRKVVPLIKDKFSIVCPDLRGYGYSEKPITGYDKKTMASDMFELMKTLGYSEFFVAGHDRGGRVAHRLTLDYSEAVKKLMVLDIVPTHTLFKNTDMHLAAGYWHWFFFQVRDFPELVLGENPEAFLKLMFNALSYVSDGIELDAFEEYLRIYKMPGTIRATLEDYRAAAEIDFFIDGKETKKIECETSVLWGKFGKMEEIFDVLKTWQEKSNNLVTGSAIKSGHFIPEENPKETAKQIIEFFT